MKKRFICLGCFNIRDSKKICCEKRPGEPYALDIYKGPGKTGYLPPEEYQPDLWPKHRDPVDNF